MGSPEEDEINSHQEAERAEINVDSNGDAGGSSEKAAKVKSHAKRTGSSSSSGSSRSSSESSHDHHGGTRANGEEDEVASKRKDGTHDESEEGAPVSDDIVLVQEDSTRDEGEGDATVRKEPVIDGVEEKDSVASVPREQALSDSLEGSERREGFDVVLSEPETGIHDKGEGDAQVHTTKEMVVSESMGESAEDDFDENNRPSVLEEEAPLDYLKDSVENSDAVVLKGESESHGGGEGHAELAFTENREPEETEEVPAVVAHEGNGKTSSTPEEDFVQNHKHGFEKTERSKETASLSAEIGAKSGHDVRVESDGGRGRDPQPPQHAAHNRREEPVDLQKRSRRPIVTHSPPKRVSNSVLKIIMAIEGNPVDEKCIHGEVDRGLCHTRSVDRRVSMSRSYSPPKALPGTTTSSKEEGGVATTGEKGVRNENGDLELTVRDGEKREVNKDRTFVHHDSQSGQTIQQTSSSTTETCTDTVVFRREDGFVPHSAGRSPLSGSQSMRALFSQADATGSTTPSIKVVYEIPAERDDGEEHREDASTSSTSTTPRLKVVHEFLAERTDCEEQEDPSISLTLMSIEGRQVVQTEAGDSEVGASDGEKGVQTENGDSEVGASDGEKREVSNDWTYVQHDSQLGLTKQQTSSSTTETYTDTVVFRREDGFIPHSTGESPLADSQSRRTVFSQFDATGSSTPRLKIVHEFPAERDDGEKHHEDASTSFTSRSVEGESEVERILRLQETHDLVCPVCKSCITKRVILRKRKRTTERESVDKWETEVPEEDNVQDQVYDNVVEEYEDWGCLGCFTFLFRREKGVQRPAATPSVVPSFQTTEDGAVRPPQAVATLPPPPTDADYDHSCLPIFKFTWRRKSIISTDPVVVTPLLSNAPVEEVQIPVVVVESREDRICFPFSWRRTTKTTQVESVLPVTSGTEDKRATLNCLDILLPSYPWGSSEAGRKKEVPHESEIPEEHGGSASSKVGRIHKPEEESVKLEDEEEEPLVRKPSTSNQLTPSKVKPVLDQPTIVPVPTDDSSLPEIVPAEPSFPPRREDLPTVMPPSGDTYEATYQSREMGTWNCCLPSYSEKSEAVQPIGEFYPETYQEAREMGTWNCCLPSYSQLPSQTVKEAQLREPLLQGGSKGEGADDAVCSCFPGSWSFPRRDSTGTQTTVIVASNDTIIKVDDADATCAIAAAQQLADAAGMMSEPLQPPEYLKSIVFGGLDVSLTSLGVVASAAGGDAKTRSVLALGLANMIFGFIAFYHKIQEMYKESPARFHENVGPRFWVNGILAMLSFLFFGSLPVITYAFTFQGLDDQDYKMAATVLVASIALVFLGCGKVAARMTEFSYRRTMSTLILTEVVAAVAGFYTGQYISKLLEKFGILSE